MRKAAKKRRGRGVASKGGKKEKGRVKTGSKIIKSVRAQSWAPYSKMTFNITSLSLWVISCSSEVCNSGEMRVTVSPFHRSDPLLESGLDRPENRHNR